MQRHFQYETAMNSLVGKDDKLWFWMRMLYEETCDAQRYLAEQA